MKLYLTMLTLFAAFAGTSAMAAPGGLTGSGYTAQTGGANAAEQREQFRCEQTMSQIQDVLKHKPLTEGDQETLKSLRGMQAISCIPPLVNPPSSAALHPAAYPMQSMRARHQGVAIVRAEIAADGSVSRDSLYRSSGYSELDQSAIEAVKGWHFDQQKGSSIRVPVSFSLGR
jgi:TonB family protein